MKKVASNWEELVSHILRTNCFLQSQKNRRKSRNRYSETELVVSRAYAERVWPMQLYSLHVRMYRGRAAKKKARKAKSCSSEVPSTSRQMTLGTVIKSRELRVEFVLDYVEMGTVADIPLEKTDKMRPFLEKHHKQAGVLPKIPTLRTTYVPKLFESNFSALKSLLRETSLV